jgi:hypothetical protein
MGLVFFWKYWLACGELRSFNAGKDAGSIVENRNVAFES